MYSLYIANKNYSSWSLRPWVLMKELAIPFKEIQVSFSSGSNWEAFRTFSPSGQVPCLHDEQIKVWDSLAITEYLAENHKNVWPENTEARAWARAAAAEMHAGFSVLRQECPMNVGIRVELKETSAGLRKNVERIDELWNEGLKKFNGPFLAGEQFTAVDAFFAPVAFRVQTYDIPLSESAMAYAERLLTLESMMEWESAALQETWREEGHEQDTLNVGTIVTDLRQQ